MYDKATRSISTATAAQSLGSVADIAPTMFVTSQSLVNRIGFLVTTAVVSTGSVVVDFYARPTYGASTNQVSIGTITIPNGAVAGAVYINNISDKLAAALLPIGYQVTASVTTATAGGSAAGAGVPFAVLDDSPALDADNANIVVVTA